MALRYANVAGASQDAHIGEDHDPESHIIPIFVKKALNNKDLPMNVKT